MIPKAMLTMAKVKSTISRLEILIFRGHYILSAPCFTRNNIYYKMLILRPSEWIILHKFCVHTHYRMSLSYGSTKFKHP